LTSVTNNVAGWVFARGPCGLDVGRLHGLRHPCNHFDQDRRRRPERGGVDEVAPLAADGHCMSHVAQHELGLDYFRLIFT
jgi:hypothetical protein